MEYTTVYEITDTGLSTNWWFVGALTVGFTAVLLALIAIPQFRKKYGVSAYLALFIVSTVGLNFLMSSYFSHRRTFSEIAAGRLYTAEGTIKDFKPAVWGRGEAAIERFTLGESQFSYSFQSHGFNQTRVDSGPLREGLHARISYVNLRSGPVITKLELGRE